MGDARQRDLKEVLLNFTDRVTRKSFVCSVSTNVYEALAMSRLVAFPVKIYQFVRSLIHGTWHRFGSLFDILFFQLIQYHFWIYFFERTSPFALAVISQWLSLTSTIRDQIRSFSFLYPVLLSALTCLSPEPSPQFPILVKICPSQYCVLIHSFRITFG